MGGGLVSGKLDTEYLVYDKGVHCPVRPGQDSCCSLPNYFYKFIHNQKQG